jgi:glutamate racemase
MTWIGGMFRISFPIVLVCTHYSVVFGHFQCRSGCATKLQSSPAGLLSPVKQAQQVLTESGPTFVEDRRSSI